MFVARKHIFHSSIFFMYYIRLIFCTNSSMFVQENKKCKTGIQVSGWRRSCLPLMKAQERRCTCCKWLPPGVRNLQKFGRFILLPTPFPRNICSTVNWSDYTRDVYIWLILVQPSIITSVWVGQMGTLGDGRWNYKKNPVKHYWVLLPFSKGRCSLMAARLSCESVSPQFESCLCHNPTWWP